MIITAQALADPVVSPTTASNVLLLSLPSLNGQPPPAKLTMVVIYSKFTTQTCLMQVKCASSPGGLDPFDLVSTPNSYGNKVNVAYVIPSE